MWALTSAFWGTSDGQMPVICQRDVGSFSVVFVAAILAGSGCHVLKKDQAVEFDAVRSLAAQLKGLKAFFLRI